MTSFPLLAQPLTVGAEVLTAARLRRVYGVEAELTRGADSRPRVTPLRAV